MGTLTVSVFGWLIPVAAVAAGVALWRPVALRLRTLPRAFAAAPLLRLSPGSAGWCWSSAGSPMTLGSSCPLRRSRSRCRW